MNDNTDRHSALYGESESQSQQQSTMTDVSITQSESRTKNPVRMDEESRNPSLHHDSDFDTEKQAEAITSPASQQTTHNGEPDEYPGPKQTIAVMIALMLTVFLTALDRTIIATAIPKITDEFNSLDDIGWYGSAYMLTSCGFQLLLGRVYTFYPPKYVFLGLIGLFEVGSAVCGAAPSSVAFIVGRAIAGIGSAGIFSGAIVLMLGVVPLHKRAKFQGLFGAVFGVASVVGPLLGGAFTTDVSWRWCFYINLPIGAIVVFIITFLLKPGEVTQKGLTIRQQVLQLDLLGELFLLPSIICLLLALQWAGSTYAWNDGRIIALFTLFGVLLVAFVLVQIFMQNTATIKAHVIKNRSIVGAMWFVFCLNAAMMISVYYLPIWFQAIEGVSAVESGIRTIPLVLALVVGSIGSGLSISRLGYYNPFMFASATILPIGMGLLTTLHVNTGEGRWIGYQILAGLGAGLGMQGGGLVAQTELARPDVPTGVAMMFFAQMLAGAVFVSVGQNIFDARLVQGLRSLSSGALSPAVIVNTGATDLRYVVDSAELPEVLIAYNEAVRSVFVVATCMAALSVLGVLAIRWKSMRSQMGRGKGGNTTGGNGPSTTEKSVATGTVEERPGTSVS